MFRFMKDRQWTGVNVTVNAHGKKPVNVLVKWTPF